jgi:hypothetical protein
MLDFLQCILFFFVVVLWIGCSMLELSKELLIPYDRCYRMIRTIMEGKNCRFITIISNATMLLKGKDRIRWSSTSNSGLKGTGPITRGAQDAIEAEWEGWAGTGNAAIPLPPMILHCQFKE